MPRRAYLPAMQPLLGTGRRRLITGATVIVLAATGLAGTVAWKPALAPIAPPDRQAFPPDQIARGATLAALGDCAVCHTSTHGAPFAGGRGVPTPFGTVFATNITPDPQTGIGTWSLAAFRRAMQDGVARDGHHLYPVLPYPHFTRAADADIAATYAFLMTRTPVHQETPANALDFPFGWRPLLAGWNLLFLRPGPWQPDPGKPAEWNRGAYLVEAIGHCGACHSPHNAFGAEQPDHALGGGEAEGWSAPPLQAASFAPQGWNVEALTTYLQTGFDAGHGAAAGPMAPVTRQLATVPDQDVRAMAVYIASLMPQTAPAAGPTPTGSASASPAPATPVAATPVAADQATAEAGAPDSKAAALFAGACGGCHGADAPMTRSGAPSLAFSTTVSAPTARNAVAMILHGLPWREGQPGPYMPGFADALTDDQITALAGYLRAQYSTRPAWQDVPATVREARRQGDGS
jgi:mono/diheme cytochrome c family protein